MRFSKAFPRQQKDSPHPVWEEIYLSEQEEQSVEEASQRANFKIMDECLLQAKALAIKHGINEDEIVSRLAVALFEKRASHEVFWKEAKAKEKFDLRFK